MIKTREQLIKKYIEFFKKHKHKEIPSASLIPENDSSVLFTTAGMHPLVPYLSGQKHPSGKRLVNVQRCIRTGDIEEVGNKIHSTFFEMLGNWSLGDYWKEEALELTFKFITEELKIQKEKLTVTCFKGDKNSPKDNESAKIWKSLGISKIKFLDKKENWWGPAGEIGPCGPDTEIFYNGIEIGNNVLMEYHKNSDGKYIEAKQKNIDFGGGVERTLAILNNLDDIYKTEVWKPLIEEIEKLSKKGYKKNEKEMRILADHLKAAAFIIADNVVPSNTERGYVLRRLIRRAVRYKKKLGIEEPISQITKPVFKIYKDYKHLLNSKEKIIDEINKEEEKFLKTLEKGLNQFSKITKNKKQISGKDSFLLFQSYGFPIEMTEELAKENKIKISAKEYQKELKKHQELSRTATKGLFSSGLADKSKETIRLHTATHLLNEALRQVLGSEVKQRGSNITSERSRFDFAFPRKLTEEEKTKVENLVNKKIKAALVVTSEELPLKKAFASGAKGEFGYKYPERVSVYTVVDKSDKRGFFSKEICTGPHVKNTKEIGEFKITKETSVSAGVRRIKSAVSS